MRARFGGLSFCAFRTWFYSSHHLSLPTGDADQPNRWGQDHAGGGSSMGPAVEHLGRPRGRHRNRAVVARDDDAPRPQEQPGRPRRRPAAASAGLRTSTRACTAPAQCNRPQGPGAELTPPWANSHARHAVHSAGLTPTALARPRCGGVLRCPQASIQPGWHNRPKVLPKTK